MFDDKKTCLACLVELPIDDFYTDPKRRDLLTSFCKKCSDYKSNHDNKESRQKIKHRYYEKNKEKWVKWNKETLERKKQKIENGGSSV